MCGHECVDVLIFLTLSTLCSPVEQEKHTTTQPTQTYTYPAITFQPAPSDGGQARTPRERTKPEPV